MTSMVSNTELDSAQAQSLLLGCCASEKWAHAVSAGWPYRSLDDLAAASERAFDGLERSDWLEAFAGHARIGRPRAGDQRGAAEQAGVRSATDQEREALETLNAEFDRRFGHVFLICASGLSSRELLASLRSRLGNTAQAEFRIATEEQRKITRLRLRGTFAA